MRTKTHFGAQHKRSRQTAIRSSIIVRLSVGLLPGLAPAVLHATELTAEAVRAGVTTWVRRVTAEARPDAVLESLEPQAAEGRTYAYVAQLAGGGYCLCGADDRLLPVYLYSPHDRYDTKDPNNQYILGGIRSRLVALQKAAEIGDPILKTYAAELSRRSSLWQGLVRGRLPAPADIKPTGGEPASLTLPVTSRWHQDSPYNDACPNLTPGKDERTVVGCIATAMSQTLYYWKWPAAGTGSVATPFPYKYRYATSWLLEPLATDPGIPASWSSRLMWTADMSGTLWMTGYWDEESVYYNATQICTNAAYRTSLAALWSRMTQAQFVPSVDFSTPIDWTVMKDQHSDPVDDGDAAVATLCYEIGVSVYMHYGLYFSSGFDTHVAEALRQYFYYDPGMLYGAKDEAKMIEDLLWLRPVLLSGDGHTWVVCGFSKGTPNQFLMNLGWGGANAWYSCDQIFPQDQTATTRIAPANVVKFVGASVSGNGSPATPYVNVEEALAKAPNNSTLIFKAGSDNFFAAATLTFDRPLTLKGAGATVRKAQ